MAVIPGRQAGAILWAQWRTLMNYSVRRGRARVPLTLIVALLWYGLWTFLSWAVYGIASEPESLKFLQRVLPIGLFGVFVYWQLVPIMMASTGISLDLNRLRVYPIPHGELFTVEVMLRITTAVEMAIITIGLGLGLLRNPVLPWWATLSLIPFTLFNLFLAAGIRDLFTRLMARRGYRELLVFLIVILTALPQLLVLNDARVPRWGKLAEFGFGGFWPWSLTAGLSSHSAPLWTWLPLLAWTALSYFFGRQQFERGLRFDAAAERSAERSKSAGRPGLLQAVLRLPSMAFRDPLAAVIEKEVRVLSRSPRFRLLFFMGFSFGLLIWLPIVMRGSPDSAMRGNYLTIVSAYALMLLGEACFWNIFGSDRTAAQTYFVMPVRMRTVLIGKNVASAFFILLEIGIVAGVCALLRMPISAGEIGEALGVTALLTLLLLAAGNLISIRYPRAVDPSQSWRTGSMGRVQGYLLLLYPVIALPVFLAYGARYAFESELAFYVVLAVMLGLGAIVYWVALDSAAETAEQRKEEMLQALSSAEGPMGT